MHLLVFKCEVQVTRGRYFATRSNFLAVGGYWSPFNDSYSFSCFLCTPYRSIEGEFVMNTETPQGIPLWRYGAPYSYVANATITPDNIGFCTPQDHCLGTGVVNITQCQIGKHVSRYLYPQNLILYHTIQTFNNFEKEAF